MGNWSLSGTLLIIAVFLLLFGFILTQISVTNPITGNQTNIIGWIVSTMLG